MNYPSFIGPSYQSLAVTADQEDCINFYYENMEVQSATSNSALYPRPGVEEIGSIASGPGRASFVQSGRHFAVIGTSFVEVGQFGAITSLGTVAIGDDPATICSNGDAGGQIFITSGDNGYIYDLNTTVFSQVRTGATTMGAQLDGYFIALDAATSTFFISDLLDGTTWDPTQFAQRSVAGDPWVSMAVINRFLWLLGSQTSDVWYDEGSFPFPFAPYPGINIPYGCLAPFSVAVADGSLYWLGATTLGQGMVLRSSGFNPEIISTYPVQLAMSTYSNLDQGVGFALNWLGHTFYLLRLSAGMVTWVWDAMTSTWTKWQTWISEDNEWDALGFVYHSFAYGENRVLDASTGQVYRLNASSADVQSREIRRVRQAPGLTFQNQRLFYYSFEIDLETGLGLSSGQGSDPQIMMQISNDGGQTWGNERWVSAGMIGQYKARARFERCGMARRRVFRIVMTDPIPWRITNAYLELLNPPQGLNAA